MSSITPGVDFLARRLLVPGVAGFIILFLASRLFKLESSLWLLALVSFLSLPTKIIAGVVLQDRAERREAEAMGARLVPRVRGKWIGNFDVLTILMEGWKNGYPGDGFKDIVREYGPVVNLRILWTNTIFNIEPECIKLMLATDAENFIKGQKFRFAMASVLGNGVFNSDGDMWKFHRSMTRPFFTRERISDFEIFDRHSEIAIRLIKERMRTGFAIDFQDLMHRLTLDSATDFLFGSCVNSLQIDSEELPKPYNNPSSTRYVNAGSGKMAKADAFSYAFLTAQNVVADRSRRDWSWPLYEMFDDKAKEAMKIVNAYLKPIIGEAVSKKSRRDKVNDFTGDSARVGHEAGEEGTLLDHLVTMTSNYDLLKDETLNIMIAARDTMSATLTFIIYFLSLHPDVTKRLREEIINKVGLTQRPTYDDFKEMKYLKAVINEALRLLPPVPINARECVKATVWPSPDPTQKPLYIPAGSMNPYAVSMLHVRKDLWGPDAEEFDPDRFLDDRLKKYLVPNPYIFVPFNAGPRICLGQQFAYTEMSFTLVRLLQQVSSFSLDYDAFTPRARPPKEWAVSGAGRKAKEKFRPQVGLTMSSEGGMWIKMREADNVS